MTPEEIPPDGKRPIRMPPGRWRVMWLRLRVDLKCGGRYNSGHEIHDRNLRALESPQA